MFGSIYNFNILSAISDVSHYPKQKMAAISLKLMAKTGNKN